MTNEQMPNTIIANGERFFRTQHEGHTLQACPLRVAVGTKTYEYWHADKGDAVRIYAVSPTQFWVD